MASRLLTRSKTLTLTLNRSFIHPSSQSLHSLTSPVDLGGYQPSDSRSASSRFARRSDLAAAVAASSPEISSIIGYSKILGYDKTLPRWLCVNAQGPTSQLFHSAEKEETVKVVSGVEGEGVAEPVNNVNGKDVICFSPLEAISIKTRSSGLGNESLKMKRTELSQKITYALIPALILVSKSPLTTSLLIFTVYWQIYGFFKEIFLDYVHQEVTRKWVSVYFNVLLMILVKDTLLDFGLV